LLVRDELQREAVRDLDSGRGEVTAQLSRQVLGVLNTVDSHTRPSTRPNQSGARIDGFQTASETETAALSTVRFTKPRRARAAGGTKPLTK
jgi:hypothetical protein